MWFASVAHIAIISLNDGTGIGNNAITNAKILSGELYMTKAYNPYKFGAYLASSVSLSSGGIVIFDTKFFDTSSNYSTSTGKFTATVAGFYQINASAYIGTASGGGNSITIEKNGTSFYVGNNINAASGDLALGVSSVIQLAATDFLRVLVSFSGGGSKTILGQTNPTLTSFSGFLVSPL